MRRVAEFEIAVLGGILLDSNIMDKVSRELESSDFFSNKHRVIFETMLAMYADAKPIDILSLHHELTETKQIEMVGGVAYVASLPSMVPSTANVGYYVDEVRRASHRRRLLLVARQAQNALEDGQAEDEVVQAMEQSLVDINSSHGHRGYVQFATAMISATRRVERVRSKGDRAFKCKTGLKGIDKMLGGLEGEEYMVIGARPSVGKSAVALQMALDMAGIQKRRVAIFTLEMADTQLGIRAVSQAIRLDSRKIRNGNVSEQDMKRIVDFGSEMAAYKLWINDTASIPLAELRAQSRLIKQREGLDVIIVDYITLIRGNARLARWEQVTEISNSMKALARELDVAVIALSQVGRATDRKRPTLADLRESGAIEQDADIVMLLHRLEDPQTDPYGTPLPVPVEMILAKNRNGPVGSVKMQFIPQYTRFEEAATEEESDDWRERRYDLDD
jgi:replicative DNA helicase